MRILLIVLYAGVLAACASTKTVFDTAGVDRQTTPERVAASPDPYRGRRVLWGGVIISAQNLAQATQLEVLGYPLDEDGRPNPEQAAVHRFLLKRPGYLETTVYAPGRLVTALGTVEGARAGAVGEAAYTFPVLAAEQVHLWPRSGGRTVEPRVHFGVGVIFGR